MTVLEFIFLANYPDNCETLFLDDFKCYKLYSALLLALFSKYSIKMQFTEIRAHSILKYFTKSDLIQLVMIVSTHSTVPNNMP
jgi:hypothetical protein